MPARPAGLAAVGGAGQVSLSWSVIGGLTYNLYWSLAPGVTPLNGTKIASVSEPYAHTGRDSSTEYFYVLTAVNSVGESAPSAEVNAPTTPAPLIFSTHNAHATITNGGLTATTDNTDNLGTAGPSGYSATLKRQCEFTVLVPDVEGFGAIGLVNSSWNQNFDSPGFDATGYSYAYQPANGHCLYGGGVPFIGSASVAGHVVGFVLDTVAHTIFVYYDGVLQGAFAGVAATGWGPGMGGYGAGSPSSVTLNAGQSTFAFPVAGAVGFY